MSNILFNGKSKEEYFDNAPKKSPLAINITDVFALSKKEAKEIADFIVQVSDAERKHVFPLEIREDLFHKRN